MVQRRLETNSDRTTDAFFSFHGSASYFSGCSTLRLGPSLQGLKANVNVNSERAPIPCCRCAENIMPRAEMPSLAYRGRGQASSCSVFVDRHSCLSRSISAQHKEDRHECLSYETGPIAMLTFLVSVWQYLKAAERGGGTMDLKMQWRLITAGAADRACDRAGVRCKWGARCDYGRDERPARGDGARMGCTRSTRA